MTRPFRRALLLLVATTTAAALAGWVQPAAHGDRHRDAQWPLQRLDAAEAWRLSQGAGVTVAVLDSGVDADHPDLAGRVLPGADFVAGRGDGRRDLDTARKHGTAMAAMIAGDASDRAGTAGLAPAARILPIRVHDAQRPVPSEAMARAIRYAVDHGAGVINISLAGPAPLPGEEDAVRYAQQRNVLVVAGAGNSGSAGNPRLYPAAYPGVLAVAAVDARDRPWPHSQRGPQIVLAAPGVRVGSPGPEGYGLASGTSDASAYVSASAALVRSRFPRLTAAQVAHRLTRTATGAGRWDGRVGYGVVQPVAALDADFPELPLPAAGPLSARPGVRWPSEESLPWGALGALASALGLFVLVTLVALVLRYRQHKQRSQREAEAARGAERPAGDEAARITAVAGPPPTSTPPS